MPVPHSCSKPVPPTHPSWIVVAALLLAARTFGAQPLAGVAEWTAQRWQTDQGLPHNAVRALVQSRDGYLWIGTDNGLARFDGVRFVTFRASETQGLLSNRIQCLHEDSRGALWIGTAGGGLARHRDGRFSAFTTREGLSSDSVLCLGNGHSGELWIGTESGLNLWNDGRVTTFFRIDGLPDDRIDSLGWLPDNGAVLATPNGVGLFRDGKFTPFPRTSPPRLGGVRRALVGNRNQLWLGTSTGLWSARNRQTDVEAWTPAEPAVPVSALIERAGGEIWYGTAEGILALDPNLPDPRAPTPIWRSGTTVTALCEDQEGNVWAGTEGDGLIRLARRQIHWVALPEEWGPSEVSCIAEGTEGTAWMAAGPAGVVRWQNGRFTLFRHPRFPEGAMVRSVCLGTDRALWIGTQGDGLYRWHDDRLTHFGNRDGLSDSAIESLHADVEGGVWIGTRNGGLNYWRDGKVRRYNTPWSFSGTYAGVLAQDRAGGLWIGTNGDGLFRLHQEQFRRFAETDGLPHLHVHAIGVDDDGSVWIGTGGGLGLHQAGHLTAFTARHGLPQGAISQIQIGPDAQLWLGTARGLLRLDRGRLRLGADGRIRSCEPVPYGKADGLTDLPCVPGARIQSGPAPPPRLWFPTPRGLAWIEPDRFAVNPRPPPVVIEQALVENEAVPWSTGMRVAAGRENFQLHFTALSLAAPEKIRFRYRLAEFDRDWNDVGNVRSARYTHVPPGHYVFRVEACNNDGLWNATGATVGITVLPFWWQTAWFKWSLLAVAIGAVAAIQHFRRQRQKEIEHLRVRIAGDLHDEVGSSLWSITLLSRILQEHGSLGDEERRDVSEIHRIAVQTSSSVRDIVWIINPTYDTVQDLVLRMKDFAGTALRGVQLRLNSERADLSRRLSLEFRQNAFLLYKEVINNVAKHARAGQIDIDLEERPGEWRMRIRDDGVGFDPARATTGHGLKSLRARAARLGGRLVLESRPGAGTTVFFTAPLPGHRPKRAP